MSSPRPARWRRTALLVIDFINPLEFSGGSRLAPDLLRAARRTLGLKERLARQGARVIYANDNFGHWRSDFASILQRCRDRGGVPAQVVELLAPTPRDIVILKPRNSAFYGTPLQFLLEEYRVERLILTGVAADNCILFTAHDAYLRSYDLWIPGDCVASETAAWRSSALAHMRRVVKADTKSSAATSSNAGRKR